MVDNHGEIVGQLPVHLPPKFRAPYDFVFFVTSALEYLYRINLTQTEFKMLLFLLSKCTLQDEIFLDMPLAVVELGCSRTNLQVALRTCISRGLILRKWKHGNKWVYTPNESLAWRGQVEEWRKRSSPFNPSRGPLLNRPEQSGTGGAPVCFIKDFAAGEVD